MPVESGSVFQNSDLLYPAPAENGPDPQPCSKQAYGHKEYVVDPKKVSLNELESFALSHWTVILQLYKEKTRIQSVSM